MRTVEYAAFKAIKFFLMFLVIIQKFPACSYEDLFQSFSCKKQMYDLTTSWSQVLEEV